MELRVMLVAVEKNTDFLYHKWRTEHIFSGFVRNVAYFCVHANVTSQKMKRTEVSQWNGNVINIHQIHLASNWHFFCLFEQNYMTKNWYLFEQHHCWLIGIRCICYCLILMTEAVFFCDSGDLQTSIVHVFFSFSFSRAHFLCQRRTIHEYKGVDVWYDQMALVKFNLFTFSWIRWCFFRSFLRETTIDNVLINL